MSLNRFTPEEYRNLTWMSSARAERIAKEIAEKLLADPKFYGEDAERFFMAKAILRLYYDTHFNTRLKYEHFKEVRARFRQQHRSQVDLPQSQESIQPLIENSKDAH